MVSVILICIAILMILDILTGMLNSVKSGTYKSCKMREGLFHKVSLVVVIAVAFILEYLALYIKLPINGNLVTTVEVYIVIMESMSILENVNKINPKFLPDKLTSIFFKEGGADENK